MTIDKSGADAFLRSHRPGAIAADDEELQLTSARARMTWWANVAAWVHTACRPLSWT